MEIGLDAPWKWWNEGQVTPAQGGSFYALNFHFFLERRPTKKIESGANTSTCVTFAVKNKSAKTSGSKEAYYHSDVLTSLPLTQTTNTHTQQTSDRLGDNTTPHNEPTIVSYFAVGIFFLSSHLIVGCHQLP
ncbi:hypothetical protein HJC23_002343 [Cyclotella cryptica]|uniref:Uncharacterized protein n=1 Tax=Cyclotella cryptica TaxID=29204 RepID=A0ABD3QL62_9STRA